MRIFGHRLCGDPADFFERRAAQQGAGAAKERRIPEIVTILKNAVEELSLVGNHHELVQISLEGIRRIEKVRSLQHAELGIFQEPAQRDLQEASRRHVIAIEDRDIGRGQQGQRVIDVAGLRMLVVATSDVANLGLFAKPAELFAPPIVEDVNVQLLFGIVDISGGKGRRPDYGQWLVVSRDQQIHMRPLLEILGQRSGRSVWMYPRKSTRKA